MHCSLSLVNVRLSLQCGLEFLIHLHIYIYFTYMVPVCGCYTFTHHYSTFVDVLLGCFFLLWCVYHSSTAVGLYHYSFIAVLDIWLVKSLPKSFLVVVSHVLGLIYEF